MPSTHNCLRVESMGITFNWGLYKYQGYINRYFSLIFLCKALLYIPYLHNASRAGRAGRRGASPTTLLPAGAGASRVGVKGVKEKAPPPWTSWTTSVSLFTCCCHLSAPVFVFFFLLSLSDSRFLLIIMLGGTLWFVSVCVCVCVGGGSIKNTNVNIHARRQASKAVYPFLLQETLILAQRKQRKLTRAFTLTARTRGGVVILVYQLVCPSVGHMFLFCIGFHLKHRYCSIYALSHIFWVSVKLFDFFSLFGHDFKSIVMK